MDFKELLNSDNSIFDSMFKQKDNFMLSSESQEDIVLNIKSYAQQFFNNIEAYLIEPCILYRPRLFIDGNQWCALYGENLQDGVCGFGNSPIQAMLDFNTNFYKAGGINE